MAFLGAYWEDDPNRLKALEARLGFQMDMARAAQWRNGWSDTTSSYMIQRIRDNLQPRLTQHMFVPFPDGGTWSAAAAGQYNSYYTQFAKNALAAMPSYQKSMYIGYGYELNGGFWYCTVKPENTAQYRAASQHFHNCLKAEGDKVGFDFIVTLALVNHNSFSSPACDWREMWQDGAHRAIGLNCYVKPFYHGSNMSMTDAQITDAEWNYWHNGISGLAAIKTFANQKGVQVLLPEIGINSCGWSGTNFTTTEKWNMATFCDRLANWTIENAVAILHWDSDRDYQGDVYKGNMPKAAAAVTAMYRKIKAAQTGEAAPPPPPATDTGGNTGGGTTAPAVKILDPYEAHQQINQLTYQKASGLTTTEIAQINAWSYWTLVAAGIKTDASYDGPSLRLGDVTALQKAATDAQTALNAAVQEKNSAVTAKATAEAAALAATQAKTQAQTALTAEQSRAAAAEAEVAALREQLEDGGLVDEDVIEMRRNLTVAFDALQRADKAWVARKNAIEAKVQEARNAVTAANAALAAIDETNSETTAPD